MSSQELTDPMTSSFSDMSDLLRRVHKAEDGK